MCCGYVNIEDFKNFNMFMKYRRNNRFDETFLRSLVDQHDSGVTVKKTRQHLLLRPIHLNNVENSLKDVLREGVAKYNKDLKGILLGFKDIKLLNSLGVISNDSCGIHIDVSANFFVFEPEVNAEMQGIVIRKSKDHIGVLVYKSFNVSIPKQHEDDEWLGSSVNTGDEVKLSITYTDFSHHLPYIRGILLSIVTRNPNVDTKTKDIKMKTVNRKIKFDDDGVAVDQNVSHMNEVIESVVKASNSDKNMDTEEGEESKKKSKRKKKKQDESGSGELIDSLLVQVKDEVAEKLKKKKKQDTVNDTEPITYDDNKTKSLDKKVQFGDDGETINQNISHIDEVIESVVNGSYLLSEKKSKKKENKSGNVKLIDPLLSQTEDKVLENLKKESHIKEVIESVVKGSNLGKEMDMEEDGASKKKLKRNQDESGNIDLIDSLLAQVKDEVSEKVKKKKKQDTTNDAEPVTYDDTNTKGVGKEMQFGDGEVVDQSISHTHEVIKSVANGSNLGKEMVTEEAKAPKNRSKRKRVELDESSNAELIDSLLAQVKDEVSEKPKKKKRKQETVNDADQ